jgi:hypothetical protein
MSFCFDIPKIQTFYTKKYKLYILWKKLLILVT